MATPSVSSNNDPPLSDPLSYDDGDVILRAGNTDFRVHIWLLSRASPFFKTMFSLPQSGLERQIPVVPIHENPTTVDFILRCIYPVKRPEVTSLEEAMKLFEVADKLDVECVIGSVRGSLDRLLTVEPNPLRSWAIATRYGLQGAQEAAADRFVKTARYALSTSPPAELAYVDALQYFRLLELKNEGY